MRPRRVWLAGVLALAGCGIGPQAEPEAVDVSSIPPVSAAPTADSPGPRVTLWFLRDDRLAPVTRAARDGTPDTALRMLTDGPVPEEADAGLTTALARQPLTVAEGPGSDGVLDVEVTRAFSAAGDDQLRAVAQVVWTATEFDDVDAVRFTTGDEPLEVPTDEGLSDQPVDRDDYASVAPARATPSG